MNTTQLECFVQVADNLNFRRAADELHLSQPTVSKQVASLERELGGALFVRSTRSVALTALGETFLPDAREILRLVYTSAERARKKLEGAEIAIGYSDPNDLPRFAAVLDRLRRERTGFHAVLGQGSRDVNLERLARQQLDMVLGYEIPLPDDSDIVFRRLVTDGLSCVVRDDSPLANRDSVVRSDFEALPQVVCLPPELRRRGYSAQSYIPHTPDESTTWCSTTTEAFALVLAGFGYALVPTVSATAGGRCRVLPCRDSTTVAYGAYMRAGQLSDICESFLETAQQFITALEPEG